jgi:rhodanese-related sulfurtransferase
MDMREMEMALWLPPADVWPALERDEIHLIDIRPAPEFCRGHPLGALCVPFSQHGLVERIEIAAGSQRPVVLLARAESEVAYAELQLRQAGWKCVGVVAHDQYRWEEAGAQWATIAERPISSLSSSGKGSPQVVLDVREPLEWETGHVTGALLIPLGSVRGELDRLPRDRAITVICEAGLRSATAASILDSSGFAGVSHLPEGTAGYRKSGLPLAYFQGETENTR